ncbi:hypothetical protein M501DRAFT_994527 [Patellaria atrata CBS 101060]|uniref:Uncharacterized protein n=1 Tax=Patellaria atrata CBS 101060 TaxID=1346257 RepID=A0A9P4SKM0_9PEZI|nr:hypothetical protein M501DRAFT_994527 [Patellaria atrata CBS 101060]
MLPLLTVTLALCAHLTTAAPVEAVQVAKSYQIRGVVAPIFHLYLQSLPSNSAVPVMGPESGAEMFQIGSTIQSDKSKLFLNIGAASTSYKPLSFGASGNTTAWGLEGDTIITTQGSSYGRQLNFLACARSGASGYYDVYLQTGSDTPSGQTCSNYQTLHLPCLC